MSSELDRLLRDARQAMPLPDDESSGRARRNSLATLRRGRRRTRAVVLVGATVVAALALKADVKVEAIEPLLEPDRVYGLIVACKAARLSWSTTTMIVRNRPNCPPSTDRELEQCVAVFESLLLSVAQWTIRFGSDRILAKKNEPAAAPTAGKKVSQPA